MSIKKKNIQECFIRNFDFDILIDALNCENCARYVSIDALLLGEDSIELEEDGRDILYKITIEKIGELESKHSLFLKKD